MLIKTPITSKKRYLPINSLKLIVSFLKADKNMFEDIIILYVDKNITNIVKIIFEGNKYIKTLTIPLKPYLANILLTEKLNIKLLKNIIINTIGIPTIDIPKIHIEQTHSKLEYNEFLKISILYSNFILVIVLKKLDTLFIINNF